jgi:allantoate deiminase
VTIAEAMRSIGLPPADYRSAKRDDLDAFVELHIEQGRILFDESAPLGVVSAITGLYRFLATVEGRTDHAGTTPMDLRTDAFQAAAEMAQTMTRIVEQAGRPAVATTGYWDVQPGAWNIVPGLVRFGVDLRHPDEATKQRLAAEIRAACERIAGERGVTVSYELTGDVPPQIFRKVVTGARSCRGALDVPIKPMVSARAATARSWVQRTDGDAVRAQRRGALAQQSRVHLTPKTPRAAAVLAATLERLANRPRGSAHSVPETDLGTWATVARKRSSTTSCRGLADAAPVGTRLVAPGY